MIGSIIEGEKDVQLKFRFSESGVSFRFGVNFIGNAVLRLTKSVGGWIPGVSKGWSKAASSGVGKWTSTFAKGLYRGVDASNEFGTQILTTDLDKNGGKNTKGEGVPPQVAITISLRSTLYTLWYSCPHLTTTRPLLRP